MTRFESPVDTMIRQRDQREEETKRLKREAEAHEARQAAIASAFRTEGGFYFIEDMEAERAALVAEILTFDWTGNAHLDALVIATKQHRIQQLDKLLSKVTGNKEPDHD